MITMSGYNSINIITLMIYFDDDVAMQRLWYSTIQQN